MNNHRHKKDVNAAAGCRPGWLLMVWWLLAISAAPLIIHSAHAEYPLVPRISLGGNTYSNVTVREVSDTTVTISHTRGMAAINQAKLTRRELEDLGLIEKAPPPKPKPERKIFAPPAEGELQQPPRQIPSIDQIAEMAGQFKSLDSEGVQQLVNSIPTVPGRELLWAAGGYFFVCLCFLLICSKAGRPSPLLVWIPVLQIFPLYRAAKMSPAWFGLVVFSLVLPLVVIAMMSLQMASTYLLLGSAALFVLLVLVHTVGQIVWCFKICTARGKSPAWGVLLLLPGLNLLALMYLAFSSGDEPRLELIRVGHPAPQRERERERSMAD